MLIQLVPVILAIIVTEVQQYLYSILHLLEHMHQNNQHLLGHVSLVRFKPKVDQQNVMLVRRPLTVMKLD